jgi:hypothetical protein
LQENIDLSSQLSVIGTTTNYIWKTKGGTTLIAGTDYNVVNGLTVFLKAQIDSVFCQMSNGKYPDLTLSSINIKITKDPVSVEETPMLISIYPNPAKELLNIELAENITLVEIYNIVGVKIYQQVVNNTNALSIPIANLPNGMLIVKVYCKNRILERKILKE